MKVRVQLYFSSQYKFAPLENKEGAQPSLFYMSFGSTCLVRRNAHLCLLSSKLKIHPFLWFTPLHMLNMWILTMNNLPVDAILLQG